MFVDTEKRINKVIDSCIDLAIERFKNTGATILKFRASKSDFNIRRISPAAVAKAVEYAQSIKLDIKYVEQRQVFLIDVDLNKATLTFTQSRRYTKLIERRHGSMDRTDRQAPAG